MKAVSQRGVEGGRERESKGGDVVTSPNDVYTTVANVFFEQASYTISVTATNITIRAIVNETLQTSITLGVIINGIEGVRSSGQYTYKTIQPTNVKYLDDCI
jgi:hypothetical protein